MNQPKVIVFSPKLVELARLAEAKYGYPPREPWNEFDEQPGPGYWYPGEEEAEAQDEPA